MTRTLGAKSNYCAAGIGTILGVINLYTRGLRMISAMTGGNITMKCANELGDLIRNSFQTILSQLSDFSPSDSMVNAELNVKEGLYEANIQIHSQELNISSRKRADSVVSLLGSIKHDLMEQIEAWKKVRTVQTQTI